MAEEGTLGTGRAARERDDDDDAPSKEELQRRMEEARESISQTVTEIKEAVTNQYNSMKDTVTEALDWRHHFRKNPVAFSVGALSAGFLVGYVVAGRLKGEDGGEGYPSYEESDLYAHTGATPAPYDEDDRRSAFHGHSYAAQPITNATGQGADYSYAQSQEARGGNEGQGDYGSRTPAAAPLYSQAEEGTAEQKPGLFERFKETSAYDRLEKEVSSLGERFMDELSTTAHTVVLPAIFNKVKELFGVDLSGKQEGQQARGAIAGSEQQPGGMRAGETAPSGSTSGETAGGRAGAQAAGASGSLASASRGSSYATSENQDYGADTSSRGEGGQKAGADSILDLDR